MAQQKQPTGFTWIWKWSEDDSTLIESAQQFLTEAACRADAERHHPDYDTYDSPDAPAAVLHIRTLSADQIVDLGGNIRVEACHFKEEPRVDIRVWEQGGDLFRRTKRGVSLSPTQWVQLLALNECLVGDISNLKKKQHVDKTYDLGGNLRVNIKSPYWLIDVRRWFRPIGENQPLFPTTKGLKLKFQQWSSLMEADKQLRSVLPEISTAQVCLVDINHTEFEAGMCKGCFPIMPNFYT